MKKLLAFITVAGIILILACGPTSEELANKEKAKHDSIEKIQKQIKLNDSLKKVKIEQKKDSLLECELIEKKKQLEILKKSFVYKCDVDEFTNIKSESYIHKFQQNNESRKKKFIDASVSPNGHLTLITHYYNKNDNYFSHIGIVVKIGDKIYECFKSSLYKSETENLFHEPKQNHNINELPSEPQKNEIIEFNETENLNNLQSNYDKEALGYINIIREIALNTEKIIKIRFINNPIYKVLGEHDDIILSMNDKKEIKDTYELALILKFIYDYENKKL